MGEVKIMCIPRNYRSSRLNVQRRVERRERERERNIREHNGNKNYSGGAQSYWSAATMQYGKLLFLARGEDENKLRRRKSRSTSGSR